MCRQLTNQICICVDFTVVVREAIRTFSILDSPSIDCEDEYAARLYQTNFGITCLVTADPPADELSVYFETDDGDVYMPVNVESGVADNVMLRIMHTKFLSHFSSVNAQRPVSNGRHFAVTILKYIFINEYDIIYHRQWLRGNTPLFYTMLTKFHDFIWHH